MQLTCRTCHSGFEVTDDDLAFYEKVSPTFAGKKELIPPPTLCLECRSQRRMAFRNEKTLYERDCDLCHTPTIGTYSPDKSFPVFCQDCFWSDKWNVLDYGQPVDWSLPFIAQMQDLKSRVPHLSLVNQKSHNSEYCNYALSNKNCYLTFGSHSEEDCMYGRYSTKNKNCLNCLWLYQSELCYECIFSQNCYRSIYLDHCEHCRECMFSVDLKDCEHCLFSVGLRHKKYYIFNQPYSEDEYRQKLASLRLDTYSGLMRAREVFVADLRRKFPFKYAYLTNCENCSGDNMGNSKNAKQVFDCANCEDIRYAAQIDETYSSMDMNFMGYDRSELCYQTIGCTAAFHAISCNSCWHGNELSFCDSCFSSNNLFGCISMQRAQYCILNKQYTKEEYEALVPRLIAKMREDGEWGEFFDPQLSPFGYNETVAQEYYPLKKEEALNLGFVWSDYVSPPTKVSKVVRASQLPDSITQVPDEILDWAIECEISGRPFKVIRQELRFLREHGYPLPRRHPDVRHLDRMALRNPRKLFARSCTKCAKPIKTTYAPDRPEKVYCEECYLKEVY